MRSGAGRTSTKTAAVRAGTTKAPEPALNADVRTTGSCDETWTGWSEEMSLEIGFWKRLRHVVGVKERHNHLVRAVDSAVSVPESHHDQAAELVRARVV